MSAAGVRCRYEELASSHGHDGFLADSDLLAPLLADSLSEQSDLAAQHAA
jgi:homoserine acetyltransferase